MQKSSQLPCGPVLRRHSVHWEKKESCPPPPPSFQPLSPHWDPAPQAGAKERELSPSCCQIFKEHPAGTGYLLQKSLCYIVYLFGNVAECCSLEQSPQAPPCHPLAGMRRRIPGWGYSLAAFDFLLPDKEV